MSDATRGLSPLAVGCTFCGANSGVSCETRNEEFIKTFHKARRDLAARWNDAPTSPTLASGASTPRHQAKDGLDGVLSHLAVPAPPTPCATCDGAGEVGTHQNEWGVWETEQCRNCDGDGEVVLDCGCVPPCEGHRDDL